MIFFCFVMMKISTILDIVRKSNAGKKEKSSPECWVIGDPEFQRNVLLKDKSNRLSIAEFKRQGLGLDDVLEKVSGKMNDFVDLMDSPKNHSQSKGKA